MVFKIIAKNRFQHVMHHNYTIPPRPQHMYDTLSYCTCCTFCILFLFWNLIIWISTHFVFTTATKRHTFYVPFSASARFGTHTRCWAVPLVLCQHPLLHTHTGVDLVCWLQELGLATTSYTADMLALCVLVSLMNSTQAGWSIVLSWSCGTAPIDIHRKWNSRSSLIQTQEYFQHACHLWWQFFYTKPFQ